MFGNGSSFQHPLDNFTASFTYVINLLIFKKERKKKKIYVAIFFL